MTFIHYAYITLILVIFLALLLKKEIVLPCFIGIFVMGVLATHSITNGVSALYHALILAGGEFWPIILIISLVVSMSKILSDIGSDKVLVSPFKRFMVNQNISFFTLGILMLLCSLIMWPSPAVALVGAVILPFTMKLGLNPIWVAVSMNIFGHGMGLSGDFFIQGAPTITAKSANINVEDIISSSLPMWMIMSVVTMSVAFFMMRADLKKNKQKPLSIIKKELTSQPFTLKSKWIAILTAGVFVLDVVLLVLLDLKGGDATALIGGSVVIITIISIFSQYRNGKAFEKSVEYLSEGFIFAMKVFAPVIVIGGFFFIGNGEMAQEILGVEDLSILNDISYALSSSGGLNKVSVVLTQAAVAVTTGLDGSGFSGLPIVGSVAYSLGGSLDMDVSRLAALGQIITIWVGGGTVIPWAVVPVAAICNVSPSELARRNIIPVLCGGVATLLFVILTL